MKRDGLSMVVHTFKLSTQEPEEGWSLSSTPVWSTKQIPSQPELHEETLSLKIICACLWPTKSRRRCQICK